MIVIINSSNLAFFERFKSQIRAIYYQFQDSQKLNPFFSRRKQRIQRESSQFILPDFNRNPLVPTVSEEKSLEGKIQFHVTIPYCEAKTCVAIEGYFNGKNIERF